jgi:hypothetical protein
VAHLAFWYDSEVQNGGHLQYFENQGTARVGEVVGALRRLGADCQADILLRAKAQHGMEPRPPISSVEEYVEIALKGEYASLDSEYYAAEPATTKLLADFLESHEGEFIERID